MKDREILCDALTELADFMQVHRITFHTDDGIEFRMKDDACYIRESNLDTQLVRLKANSIRPNPTKFIIVNGFKQAGKDTVVDALIEHLMLDDQYSLKYSSVTTVKQVATMFGWDGEKTDKNRVMLSELKDFYTKYFDGTFKEMTEAIESEKHDYIFAMIREPEEIAKMTNWCLTNNIKCCKLLVTGSQERVGSVENLSYSDRDVLDVAYDYEYQNLGTIDDIKKYIPNLIERIEANLK